MNNKERIRVKQANAEIRNKLRKAKHLERTGQQVPVVLYERVRELEQRFLR